MRKSFRTEFQTSENLIIFSVDVSVKPEQSDDAMNEILIEELKKTAEQLELWADQSQNGGRSTHQVWPMRKRAQEIWELLGRMQ